MWKRARGIAALMLSAAALTTGCGSSTRVPIEPSIQVLAEKKRGVVVMQFAMPDEDCKQQFLSIGVREGNGHRMVRRLMATGAAPATTANAAEAELEPGEYHVLGYVCRRARSSVGVGTDGGPYTTPLGSFTLGPGKVVNIGRITFKSVWGSRQVKIAVGDWAIADLNRFRDERPKLFAGMQTRLLDIRAGKPLTAEEKEDRCGQIAELKATGKVQNMPKACS